MRREINMYDPASPGACWVMECQERFGAVLITGTLEYPLVNRLVTAKIPQPPEMCVCVCVSVITFYIIELNCASICPHLHETKTELCACARLHEFSVSRILRRRL